MTSAKVAVSVVSHRQIGLVHQLLRDMDRHCASNLLDVILTLNVAEELPFDLREFAFPITAVRNEYPKGFAANHNAAFARTSANVFCVVNPDIRLVQNPFPALLRSLHESHTGIAAPLVVSPDGNIEDSARRLPTPWRIVQKILRRTHGPDYAICDKTIQPDWVAGMFMVFPSALFRKLHGFDERFFLYYEDVDICCRARMAGFQVALDPRVRVIHAARRESHRNLRYLFWHLRSMARFFTSATFYECLRRSGRMSKVHQ